MSQQPLVAIVILNWNNPTDTIACVQALQRITYSNRQIIVVDNGSTDDSLAQFRTHFADLPVLATGANLGYAGGNNTGIRYALEQRAEYVCILNNDVLVSPSFLEPLVAACVTSGGQAVAVPMVCDTRHPDVIWTLGGALDRRLGSTTRPCAGAARSDWEGRPPFIVDFAPGIGFLVPRQAFEQVGLLDERFFLYYEETDWCLTASDYGYQFLAVPASVIFHIGSATLGAKSPIIDYYMTRNRLRFIARHWSGRHLLWLLGRTLWSDLLSIAAFTVKSHAGSRLPNRNARLLALRDAILHRWGPLPASTIKSTGAASVQAGNIHAR